MTDNNFPVELPGAKTRTLMWAWEHEIEPQAVQMIRDVGSLEWVDELRIMPDVHLGKGATIGTVIGSKNAICPSAVGVDIGCGVNAVKTNLKRDDVEDILHKLRIAIEGAVPVGFNSHGEALRHKDLKELSHGKNHLPGQVSMLLDGFEDLMAPGASKLEEKAGKQLGTLGGGNHFIELCTDEEDNIWITLHSGSRNVGKELAERHISIAKKLPQNKDLPKNVKDLSVFVRDTPEMLAYRYDVSWAQEYAAVSRSIMMGLVRRELTRAVPKVRFEDEINCHHNYVAEETHLIDGEEVDLIVTRKGAISARKGELALIPGSMATGSYIVRGLGNEASLTSASHGAGRKMSRSEAKRTYTVEDVKESMKGIESRTDAGVIDEITHAYKNLEDVVTAQSNLVEKVARLQTILCVKG
ncbi:RtcB-like RNA ligase [Microbacterium phage Pumpernickel]|uniref:3'-phosphate/5'-hydroxy nucleic acid ligase n=1 Tax=Microbacterium phage Pumpernickel TaxID=2885983 RepID=A0AAE8Y759_9CAUD|nr:RtcB-like RNA ligase [Microbacterium phage Pumpernickel]UDL15924.1 RtcB-like RNA ligase [Microbacterium phage Pumpernickel]